MTARSTAAQTVRVQAIGKVVKCRNSGEPIMFIKAVSLKRKEK